jgi:hypothetical protein
MIDVNPAKLGVDNPSPRRREQRPFESWAELDAVAAHLSPLDAEPRAAGPAQQARPASQLERPPAVGSVWLPTQADLQAATAPSRFTAFQTRLEVVHGYVHNAVGGTMAGPSSPADPVFSSYYANIDRRWARWQSSHRRARPPSGNETLQPQLLFGVKVSALLSIQNLGYR